MSSRRIEPRRLAKLRAAAQLLHRPSGNPHPEDVARAICGVQAQDARAARLAFRARSARLGAAAVDRARTDERSLLRTWAMRKTMHLIAADDAAWLLPLFEPGIERWSRRRWAQLGVEAGAQERGLREIRRALAADGPLLRGELAERLARTGIRLDTSTRIHMSIVAVTSGVACLGPDRGGQTCLALRDEWLGPPGPHDRDAALRELARRYLRGFGPATEVDFAGWSGLGLSDVRSALGAIAHELTEVRIGDQRAWRLRGAARRPGRHIVRLLPAFDTYLMGYRDRDFIAAPERWSRIAPGGGLLHPVVLVDGSAAGTWRSKRSGRGIRVEIEPFAELDPLTIEALEAEVADVGRFEGAGATLDAS